MFDFDSKSRQNFYFMSLSFINIFFEIHTKSRPNVCWTLVIFLIESSFIEISKGQFTSRYFQIYLNKEILIWFDFQTKMGWKSITSKNYIYFYPRQKKKQKRLNPDTKEGRLMCVSIYPSIYLWHRCFRRDEPIWI